MTRIMRKLALLMLVPVASVWGQSWCDCGDWSVGADLLIWTHTDCDFQYIEKQENVLETGVNTGAFSEPAPAINVRLIDFNDEYVKVGYEPGVRIHGRYDTGCAYVQLSYTWLELNDSRTTRSEPFEFGPPIDPDNPGETQRLQSALFASPSPQTTSASGKIRSQYQNINVEGGRVLTSGCWGSASLYGNFRWVDIDHKRIATVFSPASLMVEPNLVPPPEFIIITTPFPGGPDFDAVWDTKFWGVGFGAGISGDFNLCCGLYVGGRLGLIGLIGEQRAGNKGRTINGIPLDVPVRVPDRTCFVPGIDVALGVGHRSECGCMSLSIELGYELHYYPHALSWRDVPIFPPASSGDQYVVRDIGYGGPSLQFTLGY